jgi:two-component system chemotaxis response regulator CheY
MRHAFHFLVVDDHPITRQIIIAMLKGLGYAQVTEVENGLKALDILRENNSRHPVDFVITDWSMPIMNGIVLLREIRESAILRHFPVLMVTAHADKGLAEIVMQSGADGYIDKQSLSDNLLKDSINTILKNKGLLPRPIKGLCTNIVNPRNISTSNKRRAA